MGTGVQAVSFAVSFVAWRGFVSCVREDAGDEVLARGVAWEGSALKEKHRECSDARGPLFAASGAGSSSLFLFPVVLTEAESLAFPQFFLIDFPDVAQLS